MCSALKVCLTLDVWLHGFIERITTIRFLLTEQVSKDLFRTLSFWNEIKRRFFKLTYEHLKKIIRFTVKTRMGVLADKKAWCRTKEYKHLSRCLEDNLFVIVLSIRWTLSSQYISRYCLIEINFKCVKQMFKLTSAERSSQLFWPPVVRLSVRIICQSDVLLTFHIFIFFSRPTGPISTKLDT